MISLHELLVNSLQINTNNECRKHIKPQYFITQYTMKKIMITIPITVAITVIFGAAMLEASIGTFESVYAQTNATNTTNANNNTADIRSAGDLENLTREGNASLSQNRGDIANPTIGLTR
jgi:hypothetical protein